MDESIGNALNAILSDPKQMAMIQGLASQLMGEKGSAGDPERENNEAETAELLTESPVAGLIKGLRGSGGGPGQSEALLTAMAPYLRDGRREKLQRAMRLSRVLRMAGGFLNSGGGDLLGL